VAAADPTTADASGKMLGSLWIVRSSSLLPRLYVLTGATAWTQVRFGDDVISALSLATLTSGTLSTTVRTSLQSQLGVGSLEWTPLALRAGFTGSAWYRVASGQTHLQGMVTRTAGSFPTNTYEVLFNVPAAGRPVLPAGEGLAYKSASNNAGVALAGYISTNGDFGVRGAGTTPRIDLSTVTPWSV